MDEDDVEEQTKKLPDEKDFCVKDSSRPTRNGFQHQPFAADISLCILENVAYRCRLIGMSWISGGND
jgi:hypothetical protein